MIRIVSQKPKASFGQLSNSELLRLVEKTKDQDAFTTLFDRLERQVRKEIGKLGSDVRVVRKIS